MNINSKHTGVLPDDNALENLMALGKFEPLVPMLKIDELSAISKKRFRSEGEHGKGRYISATTTGRIACPRCSMILKNTGRPHNNLACNKFAMKVKAGNQKLDVN